MLNRIVRLMSIAIVACLLSGCAASYITPGRGANLSDVGVTQEMRDANTDGVIRESMDKKPLATFPAAIAVARVQSPGYRSQTATGWGTGQYCIVTTRDIESPAQMDRLTKLPMVAGIAPISRLLLPADLESDRELRQAAAKLQADMLLIYTIDTTFTDEDKAAALSAISLGLSPNHQIRVTTTASAVLMDTRNGYIYGLAEATEQQNRYTNAWQSDVSADETRRSTESAAFVKLVDSLQTTWAGVVGRYATRTSDAERIAP